jgi:hypothetical protein
MINHISKCIIHIEYVHVSVTGNPTEAVITYDLKGSLFHLKYIVQRNICIRSKWTHAEIINVPLKFLRNAECLVNMRSLVLFPSSEG